MNISIYGDSIMKGTVPDEHFHYSFTIKSFLDRIMSCFPIDIRDRSRYGFTSKQGAERLANDLEKGIDSEHVLIEYGGNDCNFEWPEVSAAPDEEHLPRTSLDEYLSTMSLMADSVSRIGAKPVFMSLPPIDAERYLDAIESRGLSKKNILRWLGDAQMIYRFQEMYSDALVRLAAQKNIELVDVRSRFLDKHNYRDLISRDGIHPSPAGYELIYDTFTKHIKDGVLTENTVAC